MSKNRLKKNLSPLKEESLRKIFTVEEFDELTSNSEGDFELIDGKIIPIEMGSANIDHGILTSTIVSILNRELENSNCVAIAETTEVLIKTPKGDSNIFRPDVVVLCGRVDLDSKRTESPFLVVEVLSPSTELVDRTKKLVNYSNIPNLKGYLIVEKKEKRIEWYRKINDFSYYESFGENEKINIDDFLILDVNEVYSQLSKMTDLEKDI